MKREQRGLHGQDPFCGGGGGSSSGDAGSSSNHGKGKMWAEEKEEEDAGVDELLALSGYKVRCSDMAVVAQQIEQLEQVIGQNGEDGLVSQLVSDTVHYNPSNLSSWLESMISGFEGGSTSNSSVSLPELPPPVDDGYQSSRLFEDSPSDYDLKAIPGRAVFPPSSPSPPGKKRLKHSSSSYSQSWGIGIQNELTRTVVLVDSQENGIRLVHALMACAEAVQQENLNLAEALVKKVGFLAVSQSGAMRKVATYFAEALARRIYGLYPKNHSDSAFSDLLLMPFYDTCPYLKFAHFTANQAILEAFSGKKRVHVIDLSLKQGLQWPALMQALALQPGGPPSFRLTGIGYPSDDGSDHLQEIGWRLAQMAETIHVKFEFRGIIASSLADLTPSVLNLREGEAVAVNSVFELHQLLSRRGGIEKLLTTMTEINPEIITVAEQEANHNGPVFLDRFTESLHYYSTLFDSLESCGADGSSDAAAAAAADQDKLLSELYLGRQICNVVACEGTDRVERHETLTQWRNRFNSAGFSPVHLGSNAYKQSSMLLALFNGDGYTVEENDGCLLLGWHTRPLIATSAWKIDRS